MAAEVSAQVFLAEAIQTCKMLAARYLVGFDDSTHTRQAPGLPNHVAWSLGHLAMTMHRVAEKFDGATLPASDFIEGVDRGDAQRFGTETVAFGSAPTSQTGRYPGLQRCIAIYDAACDRLAAAVRRAPAEKLQETVPWGGGQQALGMLAARMVFHNGMHTGQIADLRRALGMKSIFAAAAPAAR